MAIESPIKASTPCPYVPIQQISRLGIYFHSKKGTFTIAQDRGLNNYRSQSLVSASLNDKSRSERSDQCVPARSARDPNLNVSQPDAVGALS
jgi:hypothetical protein